MAEPITSYGDPMTQDDGGTHDAVRHDERFWEERYQSVPAVWSRRPNGVLVAEVAGLAPGSALDVGCGEGADAIWLAEQGWQVLAVDWAETALRRGADEAAVRGGGIARRIGWQAVDVTSWRPDAAYDLVTSSFLHIPRNERDPLFVRLAAAVAPGGTLLLVGHDPSERETHRGGRPAELFFSAEEAVDLLDGESWEIVTAEARSRDAQDSEGNPTQLTDAVVRARRR